MVHIVHSTCTSISSAVKMKFTIVTTVLLGLLLTPTLAQEFQNKGRNQQVITKEIHVAGGYEILTINTQWRVAIIEGRSSQGLWKTILNYDRGFIATKVEAKNACLISVMNRQEMPEFDALPRLAEEAANLESQGQPTKEIVFEVIRRPVGDLQSYGQDTFTMCQGLTTYMASEVEAPLYTYHQGSCLRFDVLQLLDLKYCYNNSMV
ncbi:gastrokine-1 [Opisthocomus hoazin]|uniref:gastrokine-1 n=1 Tax=Opisthocomus hoazin TaxID=30419 RepID=UPI003F534C70